VRSIFIHIIYVLAYYTGINQLFYFLTRNRQRVLTFHNVIPEHLFDNTIHLGVSCSDSTFDFQIREISKRFNITTKIGIPSSCVITFDDGYTNMYKISHKILEKYSYKGVFFITSDLVENNEMLWIDKLLMYFSYLPNGRYLICEEEFVIDPTSRLDSYRKAYHLILSSYSIKDEFVSQLDKYRALLKVDTNLNDIRFQALSYHQIEEMKMYGHLIACHSSSHDVFSRLDGQSINKEIKMCELLKGNLYNCDYFSYPFGSKLEVSSSVVNNMKISEFNYCFMNNWSFSGHKGANNSSCDNFQIQRMALPNSTDKYLINAYLSGFHYFLREFLYD